MANLPVPNPRTFNAGEFETAAYFNAIRDALNFLLNPPVAQLFQAVAQSIATSTPTALSFDSTTRDDYSGHSNTSNNSRWTAPVAGTYAVIGTGSWAGNGAGDRVTRIFKNGSFYLQAQQQAVAAMAADNATVQAASLVPLAVGDYVEVWVSQSSGGALNTNGSGSAMNVWWVHT